VEASWDPVARRIRDGATDDWDDSVAVERLEDAGARFVRGRGAITAPGQVTVGDTTYAARRGIVLNTGTAPAAPPIDGLDTVDYWTNRDVVRLTRLPESIVVIGGGAIGCEMAQVLSEFGVRVTLVDVADRLLAAEEPEASEALTKAFTDLGIEVVTGAEIARVGHDGDGFTVALPGRALRAERLLVADGVWAIGDITGKGAFTHMSMYQAEVVVRDLLGQDGPWADYRAVSRVTFTGPEVGSVGLTEAAARERGLEVRAATGDLGSRGWIAAEPGLVKLVADADRGILVGGTAVGPSGGEVLSMITTAVHAEVPIATLAEMHFAYPTYHRALLPVLRELL
jgi:pyruvate/2-oxoglutarate dehydrogenase complex dihydrolipoamide dehydrogenase (E3) component